MDGHIRKIDTKIQSKETELNALYIKIQKLEEEIATLSTPQEINLQKTGNSRNVINRRLRRDLWNGGRRGERVNYQQTQNGDGGSKVLAYPKWGRQQNLA